ncbi:MAG: GPI anchored serine-threonine rich family protein, partial [Candidatus Nealsonbacteria bacterium]
QLELASAKKNYYILMARTAQVNDELSGEIDRLVEDNCRREMELEQPISLTLTAPTAEQKVKIGSSLTVEWAYTGPIGEKLRITLLKSDAVSRIIAQNIDKTDLTFTWDVSERILPSDNYQVVVLDPMSGRSVKSDKFKITKE